MPAYNSGSAAAGYPVSSDYRIAALQGTFNDGSHRVWQSLNLTYSFPTGAALFDGGLNYGNGEVRAGWIPLNEAQKSEVRKALAAWSAIAQVTFTEVADGGTVGDLRFAFTSAITGTEQGHAYQPVTGSAVAGDVWLKGALASSSYSATLEPVNYNTLLHEIGHALGLSHPFAKAGETRATAVLPAAQDTKANTLMSYTEASALYGGMPVTPMPYDILAIQYLYAANFLYRTGNDTYTYDINNINYETIWDAGGFDTLVVTDSTNAARLSTVLIDLRPGQASGIGFASAQAASYVQSTSLGQLASYRGSGVVAVAFGVTIENVVSTDYHDNITGNDARNTITSGLGMDMIDGGAGVDTSVYSRPRSSYTVAKTGTGHTVTDTFLSTNRTLVVANDYIGKDTLTSIERLHFSDTKLALDVSGHAGTTAKILGAVFGRSQVTNKEYMGIGLSLLDSGMSYASLMQAALNAKLGVGAGNAAVVNLLYANVIGTPPGASELALYQGLLDRGELTPAALGVIAADHSLNQAGINLTGLASTGIEYL